jgi:hypothetical protein
MNKLSLNKKMLFFLAIALVAVFLFFIFIFISSLKKDNNASLDNNPKSETKANRANGGIPLSQEEKKDKNWSQVPNLDQLSLLVRTQYGGEIFAISYTQDKTTGEFFAKTELALEGASFSPFFYYKKSQNGEWENINEKDVPKNILTSLQK